LFPLGKKIKSDQDTQLRLIQLKKDTWKNNSKDISSQRWFVSNITATKGI
jgi:hypothetical protein